MQRQETSKVVTLAIALLVWSGLPHITAAAPLRVMPLGDSITEGTSEGAYRTRLWQDFGSDPTRLQFDGSRQSGPTELGDKRHEGHSGFTIAAAPFGVGFGSLTAVANSMFTRGVLPDVILLMIGTNDMNLNNDVAGAPARLSSLISVISDLATGGRPSARLIVSNLLPIDDANNLFRSSAGDFSANARVQAFNAAVPGVVSEHHARGENVFFFDMNSRFTVADIADGLHPTLAGYNKLGDAWYSAIQSVPEPPGLALATGAVLAALMGCSGRVRRAVHSSHRFGQPA